MLLWPYLSWSNAIWKIPLRLIYRKQRVDSAGRQRGSVTEHSIVPVVFHSSVIIMCGRLSRRLRADHDVESKPILCETPIPPKPAGRANKRQALFDQRTHPAIFTYCLLVLRISKALCQQDRQRRTYLQFNDDRMIRNSLPFWDADPIDGNCED